MEISRRVWILKSIMWSPTKCPEMGALKMLFTRKHEIFKQLWFMVDITIVNGVYKPTYNWGHHPVGNETTNKYHDIFLFSVQQLKTISLTN
jgi:hypothetical protein